MSCARVYWVKSTRTLIGPCHSAPSPSRCEWRTPSHQLPSMSWQMILVSSWRNARVPRARLSGLSAWLTRPRTLRRSPARPPPRPALPGPPKSVLSGVESLLGVGNRQCSRSSAVDLKPFNFRIHFSTAAFESAAEPLLASDHSPHLLSRVTRCDRTELGGEGRAAVRLGGRGSGRVGAGGRAFATRPHSSVVAASAGSDCAKGL